MATLLKGIEEFEKEQAIQLADDTVLTLPPRDADITEKLSEIEKNRGKLTEYEYCKQILECLFDKEGFKKIAPNGRKINLDYLEYVQLTAVNLFFEQKMEAEQEQIEIKANTMKPITDKVDTLNSIIKTVK